MSRLEAFFLHIATILVGGTGLVYAVMRYLLVTEDAMGALHHPFEPRMQHLHVLAAPFLVFATGVIWRRHVLASWRSGLRERRRTGVGLVLSLAPMVVSGYLVQVAVSDVWRQVWVIVHGVTSALWIAGYAAHVIARRGTMLPAFLALLSGFAAFAPASQAAPAAAERVERRIALMGTVLDMTIEGESRAEALAASEDALQALVAAEARLSTWREDTELARLNRAPVGQTVLLSPELELELTQAKLWWQATRGAFDPGIGALIEAWGLRSGGRIPAADERARALAGGGMAALRLGNGVAVRMHDGLRIEEGGFGKGAALDHALAALRSHPVRQAVLDLGGQVLVLGGAPLEVEIADPRDRHRPVLTLTIDRGSVSTSGNSERKVEANGMRIGHILDPRRGEPAPDFGSLTVWAPDALTADCLSTGLYVLGPDSALAWVAAHPGIDVLAIEIGAQGLRARASAGLAARIAVKANDIELAAAERELRSGAQP